MKAFNSTVEITHQVFFAEPEKAEQLFIKDTSPSSWQGAFYTFNSLQELVPQLLYQFQIESARFMRLDGCFGCDVKVLEGFGRFERVCSDTWELQDSYATESGKIYIVEESEECVDTHEFTYDGTIEPKAQG